MAEPRAAGRTVTAGHVLEAGYALFLVAAGGRSTVQLATHAGRAPLAYALSAAAACCYAVGFVLVRVAVRRPTATARRRAVRWCAVELAGVLAVGTLALAAPSLFPDSTVWSGYGIGYLWLPLVLPVAVLVLLRPAGTRHPAGTASG